MEDEWQTALQEQCDQGTLLYAGAVVDESNGEVDVVFAEGYGETENAKRCGVTRALGRLSRKQGSWQIGDKVPFLRINEARACDLRQLKTLAVPSDLSTQEVQKLVMPMSSNVSL